MFTTRRRITAGSAVLLSSLIGSLALSAPAHAVGYSTDAVLVCDANSKSASFSTTSASNTITHVRYVSIPSGGSGSVTKSVTHVATITASVTFSASSTLTAKAVMGEFSDTVGVTLAASGETTTTTSESITVNVSAGKYAFFAGERKFTGSWSGWKCNSNGTATTSIGKGSAVSFAVPAEGAASCSKSYGSSTFEYKAKVIAC
ncbi:hypothetical protein [Actinoplanes sp. NPDC051851]|uniref:hypothetical protein n=1 Tax=Actinoplanes sp. NPDC051851 TaxID=3154753 RepID=UPI003436EE8D